MSLDVGVYNIDELYKALQGEAFKQGKVPTKVSVTRGGKTYLTILYKKPPGKKTKQAEHPLVQFDAVNNHFFKVTKPVKVNISTGAKPSNYYYGASQILTPTYRESVLKPGTEVHSVAGGLFAIIDGEPTPIRFEPPSTKSPFEKEYGFDASKRLLPISALTEIDRQHAQQIPHYGSPQERANAKIERLIPSEDRNTSRLDTEKHQVAGFGVGIVDVYTWKTVGFTGMPGFGKTTPFEHWHFVADDGEEVSKLQNFKSKEEALKAARDYLTGLTGLAMPTKFFPKESGKNVARTEIENEIKRLSKVGSSEEGLAIRGSQWLGRDFRYTQLSNILEEKRNFQKRALKTVLEKCPEENIPIRKIKAYLRGYRGDKQQSWTVYGEKVMVSNRKSRGNTLGVIIVDEGKTPEQMIDEGAGRLWGWIREGRSVEEPNLKGHDLAMPTKFFPEGLSKPGGVDFQKQWGLLKQILKDKVASGELKNDPQAIREMRQLLQKLPTAELEKVGKGEQGLPQPKKTKKEAKVEAKIPVSIDVPTAENKIIEHKFENKHGQAITLQMDHTPDGIHLGAKIPTKGGMSDWVDYGMVDPEHAATYAQKIIEELKEE